MIIPSIDIEGDRAVKRVQGRRGEYVFVGDPLELALRFSKAPLVHVVDLDGAEAGRPVNVETVEAVAKAIGGRCQVGGGLRDEASIGWALGICKYAVVGTLPFKDPALFRRVAALHRSHLVASLDYRRGVVLVDGWRSEGAPLSQAVEQLRRLGPLGGLVVTAVEVEGTGAGVALEVATSALREVAERLYYAGGIKDCRDVEKALKAGFDGVIVGYALYRGDLKECLSF